MKLVLSAITVVLFLLAMLGYQYRRVPTTESEEEPQSSVIVPGSEDVPPPPTERRMRRQLVMQPEELAQALRVEDKGPEAFDIDVDRLFDKSYENDPEIMALAELAGRTPGCIIESYKDALARIGVPGYRAVPAEQLAGICVRTDEGVEVSPLQVAEDHPYTEYSNAQLESLATTDPVASIVLARRLESNEKALQFYERAVALSWDAHPLREWMWSRNIGGMELVDDNLNVEFARRGYEIEVVAFLIDGEMGLIPSYQEELEKNGVDTRELDRAALEWAARLEQQHLELTGGRRP